LFERNLYLMLRDVKPVAVAVIGDVILDHYLSGDISRISPEAPVGILDCNSDRYALGGAANVANNLAKLGAKVSLIGMTGKDQAAGVLKKILKREGISSKWLVASGDRPTIQKTRLMANGQQLMRVDREKRVPLPQKVEKTIIGYLEKNIGSIGGIIVSDYNKGLLSNSLLKNIISLAGKNRKPVIVDPKGNSFAKYRGADVITPNRLELEKATGMECVDEKSVEKASISLIRAHSIKSVLATRGPDGMALFKYGKAGKFFRSEAKEVFDVTGAGDTVVAVFTWAMVGGLSMEDAAMLSNYAAGLQVAHLGAVSIGIDELEKSLAVKSGTFGSKVHTIDEAAKFAAILKNDGKKVVFTNGCFDLVHYGHIKYLQEARKLGDALVLGLNSDSSVRALKGKGRPVLNESDRAHVLAALDCIDSVIIFSEKTPLKLIRAVKPDILVKGGDYSVKQIVGYKDVRKWGGKVMTVKYVEGNSTTGIIEKIKRGP